MKSERPIPDPSLEGREKNLSPLYREGKSLAIARKLRASQLPSLTERIRGIGL